jgi:type II secretory pathway pseudopilin PulG
MIPHPIKNCSGFTFIAAMCIVIIMGIMLGAVGQLWQTISKREKEAELLFRGCQIRDAIERWNKPRPGQQAIVAPMPIKDLKDLLEDPRSAQKFHYLRKLYTDPITNKAFDVIRDPVKGIIGVSSPSKEQPIKTANFPDDLVDFAGKTSYSDWKFVYPSRKPTPPGGAPTTGGLPGK